MAEFEFTTNPGIDYGLGKTNIDHETGIRFGVISVHSLHEWAWDDFEANYGEPTCGWCGNEASKGRPEDEEGYERSRGACGDYHCEKCKKIFDAEEAFGDEPIGYTLDDGTYLASIDSSNDVFLIKSPYWTWAQFCSPCAPGAGHLDHPTDEGVGAKTYCFGHDWFDGEVAPYPIYSVLHGARVMPRKAAS